jgi:hypothetical protein
MGEKFVTGGTEVWKSIPGSQVQVGRPVLFLFSGPLRIAGTGEVSPPPNNASTAARRKASVRYPQVFGRE